MNEQPNWRNEMHPWAGENQDLLHFLGLYQADPAAAARLDECLSDAVTQYTPTPAR